MLAFISSFATSPLAEALSAFTPELGVLGVFLLSYVLWQRLGSIEANKRAAQKLEVSKLGSPMGQQKLYSAPRFKPGEHSSEEAARVGDAALRRSTAGARTKVLEQQIMQHLGQHEFTRALNLYRSVRPDSCEHQFSEEFYTAFIESAVRVGKTDVVERLFGALKRSGMKPSEEFWRRVLKMLGSRKHFSTCLVVHSAFKQQLPLDKVVWSCLANAALEVGDGERAASMLESYAKAGLGAKDNVLFFRVYLVLKDADAAEAVFRRLGLQATSLMLNLMLLTCVTSGQTERALRLLSEAHNLDDERSSGEIKDGTDNLVDTVSYNTVIKGCAQGGFLEACFECLSGMISHGLQPDEITFATLLDACIEQNALGALSEIVKVSFASANHQCGTVMYTIFIKGLIKANCLPKALELYEEMKQKVSDVRPDVITYSVLIKALVDQHEVDRALELVEDMKAGGHAPDDIILTHLLEGCRFAGNYELGKKLFAEILATGVNPSEYTLVTMLKLYGCVGAHQEAHDLVAGWESTYGHKPSVIHYTCLMSGCLRRKHYDLAWSAYELMIAKGVKPDGTTLATLLPAMVAAQNWDCTLALAKEALDRRMQHKIPAETFNSALAHMQAAAGFAKQAVEFRELLQNAGVPIALRRAQSGRSHQHHAQACTY